MGFEGRVVTEWLVSKKKKDRKMKLLEDFSFVDKSGKKWTSKTGSKIDGASIPKWLWGQMGGTPFVGDYRRATVIHDTECDLKQNPHKEVHDVFYEMMIEDGVPKWRAKAMHKAVSWFGPKW